MADNSTDHVDSQLTSRQLPSSSPLRVRQTITMGSGKEDGGNPMQAQAAEASYDDQQADDAQLNSLLTAHFGQGASFKGSQLEALKAQCTSRDCSALPGLVTSSAFFATLSQTVCFSVVVGLVAWLSNHQTSLRTTASQPLRTAQHAPRRFAVVVIPTGGGKSASFQLCALAPPAGLVVAVLPLLALMDDQGTLRSLQAPPTILLLLASRCCRRLAHK